MLGKREKLHIIVTVAVMVLIFVHSAMPGDMSGAESGFIVRWIAALTGLPAESLSLIVRKGAHFTEFMVLGGCFVVNVRDWIKVHRANQSEHEGPDRVREDSTESEQLNQARVQRMNQPEHGRLNWRSLLMAWAMATAYAATDEFHQLFVDGRAGAVLDVCIDAAGAAVGVLIVGLVLMRNRKESDTFNSVSPIR